MEKLRSQSFFFFFVADVFFLSFPPASTFCEKINFFNLYWNLLLQMNAERAIFLSYNSRLCLYPGTVFLPVSDFYQSPWLFGFKTIPKHKKPRLDSVSIE